MLKKVITLGLVIASISFLGSAKSLRKIEVQKNVNSSRGDSSETEQKKVDPKILFGAIRYAFLKYKVGGDIIFDVDESVSMTGNSGPYLQYAAVRAQKVLGKIFESQ